MRNRTDGGWRPPIAFGAILVGIAGLLAADLATDQAQHATGLPHLVVEALAAVAALGAAAWVLLALRARRDEVRRLSADLETTQAAAEHWRREAGEMVKGLSQAIDHQFDRWELSPAEREVALLLLKGLSTREIGDLRNTREATVRQQAQGIYRKAGLVGRAELAAFFLEDLLAPSGPREP
ncbi:MAG TPA: LuxR C-terminal-related transcriptional regulator [Holophaga sp.]|nr:LuxR C-terminal-related transcriptional regulator [Holophaga sp.]